MSLTDFMAIQAKNAETFGRLRSSNDSYRLSIACTIPLVCSPRRSTPPPLSGS